MTVSWMTLTEYALPGISLLLVAVFGMLLLSTRRTLRRQALLLKSVKNDLRALCSSAVGVGERVGRLEGRLRQLSERQDQLDLREPSAQPYQQAIKLVHNGADVDEIVEACGLSRGEAELVMMMHRLDEAS